KLGGARVILATATSGDAMSAVQGGLAVNGTLLIVGAAESMQVSPMALLMGCRSVKGWYSGTSIDSQDTLAFSVRTGVRPMNESYPFERVAEAYDRMMSGKARFRVVLTIGEEPPVGEAFVNRRPGPGGRTAGEDPGPPGGPAGAQAAQNTQGLVSGPDCRNPGRSARKRHSRARSPVAQCPAPLRPSRTSPRCSTAALSATRRLRVSRAKIHPISGVSNHDSHHGRARRL